MSKYTIGLGPELRNTLKCIHSAELGTDLAANCVSLLIKIDIGFELREKSKILTKINLSHHLSV